MMRETVVAALLAGGLAAGPALAACSVDKVNLRGPFGQVAFSVEIADEPAEQSLGLMHRPSMPRFSGMLFDFHGPGTRNFWMENTLIPLDMLFIDETGVVRHIHHRAVPLDRTPIPGGSDDIRYVLEINGGMAETLRLMPGIEMQHPSVPADRAVWACD